MTLTEFSGSIRRVLGADLPLGAVTRLSRYTFAARQAERYRDGRILLAHVPCCRPKPRRHCDAETTQPPRASATAAVAAAYMDTTRAIGVEFVEAAHDEPEEWRDAALDNADLWLLNDPSQPKKIHSRLEGAGLGIRLGLLDHLNAEFLLAKPLVQTEDSDRIRYHFRVVVGF